MKHVPDRGARHAARPPCSILRARRWEHALHALGFGEVARVRMGKHWYSR